MSRFRAGDGFGGAPFIPSKAETAKPQASSDVGQDGTGSQELTLNNVKRVRIHVQFSRRIWINFKNAKDGLQKGRSVDCLRVSSI